MSEQSARSENESWLTTGMSAPKSLVKQLPPSAKLVLCYLRDHGRSTKTKAADELCLPASTTEDALAMLKDKALVEDKPSVRDARVMMYELADDHPDADIEHPVVA